MDMAPTSGEIEFLKSWFCLNRSKEVEVRGPDAGGLWWLSYNSYPRIMICFSWNCQGLGASLTVKTLKEEVKKNKPQIVFLMETKQNRSYLERISRRCGFDEYWYVDPVGRSGGLALWWCEGIFIDIKLIGKGFGIR
ncbi:uncharacterized protein LOC129319527 [Prosopis cineraria]|uniref:uncharacterized protein LOC129319527 n=1 Tax=Prosopis cineraria TaxID=364024 RepID=UPI00240F0D2F|nr:uncharacterized protein LOC129319527 [Prosopis cineraria]